MVGADPTFSTTIEWDADLKVNTVSFSWVWLAAAGKHLGEKKTLFALPVKDEQEAMNHWFVVATPDIPKGPEWLHDIALQDYDFLSKNGKGWFADIDAACKLILPEDRHRALFCMHGWYDYVGRYCYDRKSRKLDEKWTTFPYINHPEVQKLSVDQTYPFTRYNGNPTFDTHVFRNLELYDSQLMTWDEIRRRLSYAKERGFRTAFYALTGLQIPSAEPVEDDGMILKQFQGRQGPDSSGATSLMNPLHPNVVDSLTQYIRLLLHEVGDVTDALVMDEAYYIGRGMTGPESCPGYADRVQMLLIREFSRICHAYRPDLAFLTADYLGASWNENSIFPYSLFCDGIYQDTIFWPLTWDHVRFPAWRNIAWCCNWSPVHNIKFTKWGVMAYNAAIGISNGCWGDDIGLSEMSPEVREQIRLLWDYHKHRKVDRQLTVIQVQS